MLINQFIGLNIYFAINLLIALVCFGVFWLIFDAWTLRHSRVELTKAMGFLLLAIGFLLRATAVQTLVGQLVAVSEISSELLRLVGYCAIVTSQIIDPIMERPVIKQTKGRRKQHHAILPFSLPGLGLSLAAALCGYYYWRRATVGLERHLRPVAAGFAALTGFELLNGLLSFQNTPNPTLYQIVCTFGPVWWGAVSLLAVASLILGSWTWRYLTKRLQSELFMALVAQALGIFLFTTVGFTFFLLQATQKQALTDLTTASGVLHYAVDSQEAETSAQTQVVAENSNVTTATQNRDTNLLAINLKDFLPQHNLTSLVVVDGSGQVLYRGEDPERFGDSRSNDPLVRHALIGESVHSVVAATNATLPTVTMMAANPIRNTNGDVIGAVVTGRTLSQAFVDGVHQATGLDSTVYSGSERAATTLIGQNGVDRATGVIESNATVIQQVIAAGQAYTGAVNFDSRPYLAAYLPLKDITNQPVGMLLVARPTATLYAAAYQSIQLIFLLVIALAVISIYPIFRLSRYLSRQLH